MIAYFTPMPNAAFWLKLFNPSINACNLGAKTRRRAAHIIDTECWCCALAVVFLAEVGRGFGWGWCALVCFARSLRCFVCLLGLLLCACFRLFLPLLGFLILLQLAPCLVRVCAGRGQPLCPWDREDKVVSSCWWVRACFIHPETLFQTLSQVISRRIRPRLAPRTPFNNNPAGAVFHRLL